MWAAVRPTSDGLAFVENRGQWPDDVLYLARLGGADVWVTRDGLVYDFYRIERADGPRMDHAEAAGRDRRPRRARRRHALRGGPHAPRAEASARRAATHNYFLGDDPARWASRVPLYDEVRLAGLYDGVDLRLYAEGGLPRYDLVLAPGADLSAVRLRLDGADAVSLTAEGALRMGTSLGPVEQRGLLAYHEGVARRAGRGRERVRARARRGALVPGGGGGPVARPRDRPPDLGHVPRRDER